MSARAAGAQPVDAVLADADDGQPAAAMRQSRARSRSGSDMPRVLILGGTSEARRSRSGSPAAPTSRSRCRSPAAPQRPCAQPVPVRASAASAAPRASPTICVGERIDALIDATHPYAATISANAVARRTRAGVPAAGAAAAAVDRGRRRPLDRGRRRARRRCARSGNAPRRVFLALGRQELAPFARAPQHHYLVRSVDPVDPPLAVPHAAYVTGRGPFGEADDRALLRDASHRRRRRQEQRRQRDLRQDRARRARSASRSSCCAGRALPEAPAVETVDDAVAWLAHALTSAAARGV